MKLILLILCAISIHSFVAGNSSYAIYGQTEVIKKQNRLLAAMALCVGAFAATHLIDGQQHPMSKRVAKIASTGACIPALSAIIQSLE